MPVSPIERKYAAMRLIDRRVLYHYEQERILRPRQNELAVGSADFDHLLKATVYEAYLRILRGGGSPQEAHVEATKDGNDCIKKWNDSVHKTRAYVVGAYELRRWENAGKSEADNVHMQYLGLIGRK